MTEESKDIEIWEAPAAPVIIEGSTIPSIVQRATGTLSRRDVESITNGFNAESYETVSTFVWTKTAATLKKQLGMLGMGFVGEMLERPDLDDNSDPSSRT